MVSVGVTSPTHLTNEQLERWSRLQEQDPTLDSPFFRPEYAQLASSVRSNIEVAVLRDGGKDIGFFPFERRSRDIGLPLMGRLSEFHGAIVDRHASWDAEQLVRESHLSAWFFDHLVSTQAPFDEFAWNATTSPYMDLAEGFDNYVEKQRATGFKTYTNVLRKARKMEREVGPLRFEVHTSDPSVIDSLVEWKSAQYERTGRLRLFRHPWVVDLMRQVQQTQSPSFSGVVSALYAGDKLVAVHAGLRSRTVFHIWFPAYDRDYQKYSPGLVLLVRMAESLSQDGIQRVDFGRGPERYKASFKSGDTAISIGAVDTRLLVDTARRRWQDVKKIIRSGRGQRVLAGPLKVSRRVRDWLALK